MFPSVKEQLYLISKNTVELIPLDELEQKLDSSLKKNTPLTIKLGCDPSRPDLHIGHGVVLQKLRDFQDLGHKAVLIIGDFTAMIGDPSGRNKTRPPLSLDETRINGQTYFEQASKILSEKNLEIKYNSEWLDKMNFSEVIKLASNYTVARMLERDDFEKRFKSDAPISMHELLYPLSQAMDSVAIKADVELGGTDQKFNLLVGRDIQTAYGLEPQCIITMELLEGTDGIEKMSKSLNNAICFTDTPNEIFGKTMSIPDPLIYKYFKLCTDISSSGLQTLKEQLTSESVNPRDLKVKLAQMLVKKYYDKASAEKALEDFEKVFKKKEIPDDIAIYELTSPEIKLTVLMKEAGLVKSTSEASRLIDGGGVSIDSQKIHDKNLVIKNDSEFVIKAGKRKFVRIVPKK